MWRVNPHIWDSLPRNDASALSMEGRTVVCGNGTVCVMKAKCLTQWVYIPGGHWSKAGRFYTHTRTRTHTHMHTA